MARRKSFSLATALETWFAVVKRPMPWRLAPSPYTCWLSEILMQQTTYASALPYYERFLKRFPLVEVLAAASEEQVLKAWEGLGYYARARNLHRAARLIVVSGRPIWPTDVAGWAALPGIGPYTAAALASVLNGAREPVVDGNVARVFARVYRLADDFSKLPSRARLVNRLRPEIAAARVPGDFNQAMMELGALVCTPTNPACDTCPLMAVCAARKTGEQAKYPVKPPKKAIPVRQATGVVITDGAGRVLLVQNREGNLLKGLWELPTVLPAGAFTQIFSHFRFDLTALQATSSDVHFCDPHDVPLTTVTKKVLAACNLL